MKRIYKDQQFKVRLTKTQLAAVREAAAREGMSVTQWAVKCLLVAAAQGVESRLRGITVKSQPLSRPSDRGARNRTEKNKRVARTARGRTSASTMATAPDAAKARRAA